MCRSPSPKTCRRSSSRCTTWELFAPSEGAACTGRSIARRLISDICASRSPCPTAARGSFARSAGAVARPLPPPPFAGATCSSAHAPMSTREKASASSTGGTRRSVAFTIATPRGMTTKNSSATASSTAPWSRAGVSASFGASSYECRRRRGRLRAALTGSGLARPSTMHGWKRRGAGPPGTACPPRRGSGWGPTARCGKTSTCLPSRRFSTSSSSI